MTYQIVLIKIDSRGTEAVKVQEVSPSLAATSRFALDCMK